MSKKTEMDAYEEGWDACRDGGENPYQEGTPEHAEWKIGFNEAHDIYGD